MEEDDEWELCNDDGFVYKRKRRRIDPSSTAVENAEAAAAAENENRRRERKKRTLLKLKTKYENEIREWDTLSNTLRAMQNAALQQQQQRQQEQRASEEQTRDPSSLPSTSSTDSVGGSLLDELLLQVETQEAIIQDISNLCNVAESVCFKREEQFKKSLFHLPIWASPVELMQALCDE
ncbi:hypothetical protein HN51_008381 [Arachis hypogaea]|uniref:Uncharacterized protein n=1 Tax=Arachis hypogaea TaxID=3818 RepID=A0A445D3N5_ARAHY|nr:uncharacterized protein LOC112801917 [Arachis hypogaea]QHO42694.1 uncharacterized protein DS421_5g156390 [Arachis hypogaea]RYR57846.1 hypothetical protein Ahy_A05g023530 [Arachis hypogaea]